jgi:two-component system sensor histidine kinase TctE
VLSTNRPALSLRRYLLLGILAPIGLFMLVNTFALYRQALGAVNTAYDRTLLASAKSIGELLDVDGEGVQARFRASVPYSALEAFEADNRSRMVYRISDVRGQLVDGTSDLPLWQGRIPDQGPYAALVDFYDDELRGDPVRVAVLLQPVASQRGRGMATIQVAETLELRRTLARQILIDTLWRQTLLASVIALVVVLVVQRATRPVRRLSAGMRNRPQGDLRAIDAPDVPRELRPLIDATNQVWSACSTCWTTKSGLCAMRRTSCERHWPCSRRRCSRRCAATSRQRRVWPKSVTRWNGPRCWPTRCWRWPRWSNCASRRTARYWTWRRRCAPWRSTCHR